MKPHPALRGFTLVEVLVAMTVMALMAVMAWQGVDGIVRSRNASQVRLEQTLRLNTVMAQWEQDLASIQDNPSAPQAIACDGASVRLTRRTPDGLQIVAWSLRPDDSGGAWVRWAGPAVTTVGALQDSWLRSLQLQGGEPGSLKTLTGVQGWQVYFYRNNGWSNCQSSGDVVQGTPGTPGTPGLPAPRTQLPDGVRMVMSFVPGNGLNGDLTRDTLVRP
jgi:general secretion pathway protein J